MSVKLVPSVLRITDNKLECERPAMPGMLMAAVLLGIAVVLSACGGGGGGSSQPVESASVNDDQFSSSDTAGGFDAAAPDPADSTSGMSTAGVGTMDTGTADDEVISDTGNEVTDDGSGDTDASGEDESGEDESGAGVGTGGLPQDNMTTEANNLESSDLFFFLEEGEPAPGAGERLLGPGLQNNVRFTTAGDFVYLGRLEEDRFGGGNSLWGGSLFNPQLLIEPDVMVDGFAANVRSSSVLKASLSSNGEIAAVLQLEGASAEGAILHFLPDQLPVTIARTSESLTIADNTLTLNSMDAVDVESGTVAFSAQFASFQSVLLKSEGDVVSVVAPEAASRNAAALELAPRLSDGCIVLFEPGDQFGVEDDSSFAVAPDGSIVFNAVNTIEEGAVSNDAFCPQRFAQLNPTDSFSTNRVDDRFGSVVRYTTNGEYQRLATRGDQVPGMNAGFNSVSLVSVLDDSSVVIRAELLSYNNNDRSDSLWVYDNDNNPRLIAIEGESVELNGGNLELDVNRFSAFLSIENSESIALTQTENRFSSNEQSTILTGAAHIEQPYTDLESLGASSLQLAVTQGSAAPEGYPDSAFFSGVGSVTAKPSGGGYFFGAVSDSAADGLLLDSGLWQFDTAGTITPVVLEGDIITLNEIPRSFENFSGIDFDAGVAAIGDNAVVMVQMQNSRERLVYWLVE